MPEISVIIPVYNVEQYLDRCIKSILQQTYSDIELILVDDGSTDKSGYICDKYKSIDKRIIVAHKENGGVSSARNLGLDLANGKYIMFCDSDDYVGEEWCKHLYDAICIPKVHLAVCGVTAVSNGVAINNKGVLESKIIKKENFVDMAKNIYLYELWNKIFRKDIIDKIDLRFDENIKRCEDGIFTLRYIQEIASDGVFCYGSLPLYFYEVSTLNSLTKRYVEDYWNIEMKMLEELKKVLIITNNGLLDEKFYAEKVAFAISTVVSNIINSKNLNIKNKYERLKELTTSNEYSVAIKFGGIEKVASGRYLKVLKSRKVLLILLYHYLHKVKC